MLSDQRTTWFVVIAVIIVAVVAYFAFVPADEDPNTGIVSPADIEQTEDQVTSEENSIDEALSISEEAPARQDASETENLPLQGVDSSDAIEPEIEETEGMPQ